MTSPTFTVEIAPAGFQFEADGATPLLQAAERAGIALPSSCRNGTCRTCMCQVLKGSAAHLIEWPGLSAEEKREGWILPCCAVARGPVTLLVPAARQTLPGMDP
jgi:ferredoxin